MTEKSKRYYERHREEVLRKKQEYRDKNREKIREQDRKRYQENPEKAREKSKNYYHNNPEKVNKYKEENREKILASQKRYREENQDKIKAYYQENKEIIQDKIRKYRKEHPEVQKRCNTNFVINTRNKLFDILGGKKCVTCNESDDSCLQFDHIKGNGHADRKKHGNHSRTLYLYYIAHPDEARKTLQVMCSNCNWKKKKRNNENSYQYKLPPID
jgi:hypothetical protein